MAPRHAEMMDRHSIRDGSTTLFEESFGVDEAFDPFDTTDHEEEDFGESFANDFDDVEFPEKADAEPSRKSSKTPRSRSRRPSSRRTMEEGSRRDSARRLGDSSHRLGDSSRRLGESGRRDSSRRLGESTRRDSSRRLGDSSSRLDESTHKQQPLDGSLSRIPDGPRRRARNGQNSQQARATKPTRGPSFPKNTARRCSSSTALEKQSSGRTMDGSSRRRGSTTTTELSPRGERGLRSKNRRSITLDNSDCPISPATGGTSSTRRSSVTSASSRQLSPKDRMSSRRATLGNSDARLRIRKAAALQREREQREQEEAKMKAQKAKLEKQKQKTNDLLGRKLANLDAMGSAHGADHEPLNGDGKSVSSKNNRAELNSSMHSAGTRGGTAEQRRRHRRTHLSHNILVRNMNQLAASSMHHDSSEFGGDETEHTLDEITEETEEMSVSSAELAAKKAAWQRRRERQHRG
ncbi:expressed unknown protein [Seminavis robusta]|uniref:Uncharacterized protein n=1 Tax=Seminavis robusta TaxID=568900 RepID=A0A9N8E5G3_9STRA|nr:expressed unknown protein [Seminavis robusta]|eukprot:Sro568_g168140.1 n/a (465) ;mRNA; f:22675-24069